MRLVRVKCTPWICLSATPETWAVNLLLSTGSADFSHRFVTPQSQGGLCPEGYSVRDARVWRNGAALAIASERELFELWGLDYLEPREREVVT